MAYLQHVSKKWIFFFSQLRNERRKSCSRNAIKFQRPINVTGVMSVAREFRCGLSKFHCRNEVTQGRKVQAIKL